MSSQSGIKFKVSVGWNADFVFSPDDALKFIELLGKAEVFEVKYHNDSKETTQHVYPVDLSTKVSMGIMSDTVYHVAKMAGKPE